MLQMETETSRSKLLFDNTQFDNNKRSDELQAEINQKNDRIQELENAVAEKAR